MGTMMNVQTMRYIVDPIRNGDMPQAAREALERWRGEALEYVRSSANHIFRFTRGSKPLFLRLSHESERDPQTIQAELDFILHCAGAGLAVARPVASRSGALIEAFLSGDGLHYAVAFEGLEGDQYEAEELDDAKIRAWGGALAALHQASASFPATTARQTWQQHLQATLDTLPAEETALAEIIGSGIAWLNTLPKDDYGLIHGDFEQDNLVWQGNRPQILDFDAGTYTWFGVDIAIAVQDFYFDGSLSQIDLFLDGYAAVRPLPEGIREHLPRLSRLMLAAKIADVLHALSTTRDDAETPAWHTEMQAVLRNWIARKRALLE